MPTFKTYESIIEPDRQKSFLHKRIQLQLKRLGFLEIKNPSLSDILRGRFTSPSQNDISKLIKLYRKETVSLDPLLVPLVSYEIRNLANLFFFWGKYPKRKEQKQIRIQQLSETPELGWVFLFHGDGYVREAAIGALNEAPASPFELASIIYCMNDWVPQVRSAALLFGEQYFSRTKTEIIGHVAFKLFPRIEKFRRWDDSTHQTVRTLFLKDHVLKNVIEKIRDKQYGSVAPVFSQIIRDDVSDQYLPELAENAKTPFVRAMAYSALLNRKAKWLDRYEKVWTNKIYGEYKRQSVFQTRDVRTDIPEQYLLEKIISDKAVTVRKVAINYLNYNWSKADSFLDEIAIKLAKHERHKKQLDFYVRKRNLAID